MKRSFLCLTGISLLLTIFPGAHAQQLPLRPEKEKTWTAHWIFHPTADPHAYGIFHFRKQLQLATVPERFIVHVSGDNRYELLVNGKRMSVGPARADQLHWRYETVDLAPALKKGKNTIAAVVWNQGKYMAWAQLSYRSGFLLQGDTKAEAILNSDPSWKVMEDKAYLPPGDKWPITGPSEKIQAADYPWGWEKNDYDDHTWLASRVEQPGLEGGRILVPRNIPFPEQQQQRFKNMRSFSGGTIKEDFIKGTGLLSIPAYDSVTVILDQGDLTTAFPELWMSGGKGATVTITYAEALVDPVHGSKGNRDSVAGKVIRGDADIIFPDGGNNRLFRPLWYRTFRYVGLKIITAGTPLRINDFYSFFTAYPFKEKAAFASNDTSLEQIWKIGWRTARLCSYETYMDCPYYEQLQYIGDTRIQALISYSVAGDDRLIRNAIEQFSNSFSAEGLTHSRYPESRHQIIPPFSLFWIGMLFDYWRYRPDTLFIRQYIDGIRQVLDWHARYIDSNGMLRPMPYWNFVDWPKEWPWKGSENNSGIPEGALDGHSSILTLQYVYALQKAVDLFRFFHLDKEAAHYSAIARQLRDSTFKLCWDDNRKLLANTPERSVYSQHANVMGVLTDMFPPEAAKELIQRVAFDTTIIQCTYYYRFYLNQAMKQAGLGDQYIRMLQPWRDMIRVGLTTFAERPEPTRSDCHAWSASPNYDLLATVAGIEPASPGFSTVRIRPHLGPLSWIEGKMPAPSGEIKFMLKRVGQTGLKGEIILPAGLTGTFIWNATTIVLHPGRQEIFVEGDH